MNVTDIISNLNSVFEKMFKSIEGEVYEVLDNIMVIKSDILSIEPIDKIISSSGFILIANSIILFLVVYYTFTVLISMYNGNKSENVYHLIIKLILVGILVNNSYFLIEQILNLNESLTLGVESLCEDLAGKKVCFNSMKESILSIKDFMKTDFLSLDGLIKGVLSFGTVTILINFCVRYVTIVFLIIISPIAFCLLASDLTSNIFFTWIKMLAVNLFSQVVLKIILVVPLMYKDTGSMMYKIILIGTIYIIYKFNGFVKEFFSKFSKDKINKNIFN